MSTTQPLNQDRLPFSRDPRGALHVTAPDNCTLRATQPIPQPDFQTLRRTVQLDFCKWDSQVEDLCAIAPFALLLEPQQWRFLATAAEELTQETLALENALLDRPDLHKKLALPRPIRKLFAAGSHTQLTPSAARVMRFDFHPTPDGWRISEVNSDVPGGYTEASAYAHLMQQHFPQTETAGDPACGFANAIASHGKQIALIASPGLIEDQQVIANLAHLLRERNCQAHLAQPRQLTWKNEEAYLAVNNTSQKLDAIIRFYQIEWLAALPRRVQWRNLFTNAKTPVANPGIAAFSESKRLPLLWNDLKVPLKAWPKFLPETRDPRDAPWGTDENWLLKSAYCNNGESVANCQTDKPKHWRSAKLDIFLHRNNWIAQKRFQTTAIQTPLGEMHPCIGVYTINGIANGIYARLAPRPVIDYRAIDVPVLITRTERSESNNE